MNQLFYYIAGGIVHQIRREKRTAISEVIFRGKWNIKQNFRCFSLFLPHLRTLTQEKRSQNCLRFGTGGPSLCLYPLLSRNAIFFRALAMTAREKNKTFLAKQFAHAISGHYISGFWARLRKLNVIGLARALCYKTISFTHSKDTWEFDKR